MEKAGYIKREILIPISLFAAISSTIFFAGVIYNKVESMEKKDSPSRAEYKQLSEDVIYIRTKIDTVILKAQANVK